MNNDVEQLVRAMNNLGINNATINKTQKSTTLITDNDLMIFDGYECISLNNELPASRKNKDSDLDVSEPPLWWKQMSDSEKKEYLDKELDEMGNEMRDETIRIFEKGSQAYEYTLWLSQQVFETPDDEREHDRWLPYMSNKKR